MHARNHNISKDIMLIADDDEIMRTLIKEIFADTGFDFYEAKNGNEALNFYHIARPALVITDINMPVMNGLDFIRRVRQTDRGTPIIAASTDNALLKLALRDGANAIFQKMSGITNLIESVASLTKVE